MAASAGLLLTSDSSASDSHNHPLIGFTSSCGLRFAMAVIPPRFPNPPAGGAGGADNPGDGNGPPGGRTRAGAILIQSDSV